jgi:hypothetical protein
MTGGKRIRESPGWELPEPRFKPKGVRGSHHTRTLAVNFAPGIKAQLIRQTYWGSGLSQKSGAANGSPPHCINESCRFVSAVNQPPMAFFPKVKVDSDGKTPPGPPD